MYILEWRCMNFELNFRTKYVPKGPIDKNSIGSVMVCCQIGYRQLSEPMVASFVDIHAPFGLNELTWNKQTLYRGQFCIWRWCLIDKFPDWNQYLASDNIRGVWSERAGELGWELFSKFPPFRYFPNFSELLKHMSAIEYHVYIWQVSPHLSCSDTCQIWMGFKECNRYFCKTIVLMEKLTNGVLLTTHPW